MTTIQFLVKKQHLPDTQIRTAKEDGYDDWLRARLEKTIQKLDSGEMKSSPIEEVEMRLKAKREQRRARQLTTA